MKNGVSSVAAAVVAEDMGVFLGTGEVVGHFALSAISILEIDNNISAQRHILSADSG